MASDQNRSNPENQSYRSRYHPKGRGRGQNTIGSQAPSTSLPRRAVVRQGRERDFSHIASVSRSSGLDKDGDALKDKRTQEEYRAFIEQKLSEYWRLFPIQDRSGAADVEKSRQEKEGNILIQLRKLREGLSASRRHDAFAIESYETSLHLSIIFNSAVQTTSIASHLPELYRSTGTTTSPWTIVLTLLHDLAIHGPSQRTFYERRKDFDKLLVEESLKSWLGSLAHALHRCDFSRFQLLSRLESVESLFPRQSRSEPPGQAPSLPMEALAALLQRLRSQARTTSWRVMRSAYRGEFGSNSRAWFARQLFFDAESSPGREELLAWLIECEKKGEVFRKEGADFEERWAVLVKR